jgi:spermidine/putrescine transport system substrate-binding protein
MLMRSGIVIFWVVLIFGFLWTPWIIKKVQPCTLNILSWTELIDREKIAAFEQRTGIKVNVGYYESNNELFVKLKVTKGAGYDLIIPSDYLVEHLIKESLLQKLDHARLNFWHRLNPHLLHQSYDPGNEYAIPYVWSIYGLGINKKFFNAPVPAQWSLLFNAQLPGPVVMLEDALETILLTGFYLYGSVEQLDAAKLEQIKTVLAAQKRNVISYTDSGAPYLLISDQAAVALTSSPYIARLVEQYPYIDFVVPDQGTFMVIDNLVIPALSTNQDLVYKFINFLYEPEVLAFHLRKNYFLSPTTDVPTVPVTVTSKQWLAPTAEHFTQFHLFNDMISLRSINQLWLALKSL